MVSARHEGPTRIATLPAFTKGSLIRCALLVVSQTRLAPDLSITSRAGDFDGGEGKRGARHIIATRFVTHVCNVSPTPFVTCITYVLLHHRARYIHDHVIVSFDIIVE